MAAGKKRGRSPEIEKEPVNKPSSSSIQAFPCEIIQHIAIELDSDQDLLNFIRTCSHVHNHVFSDQTVFRGRFMNVYDPPLGPDDEGFDAKKLDYTALYIERGTLLRSNITWRQGKSVPEKKVLSLVRHMLAEAKDGRKDIYGDSLESKNFSILREAFKKSGFFTVYASNTSDTLTALQLAFAPETVFEPPNAKQRAAMLRNAYLKYVEQGLAPDGIFDGRLDSTLMIRDYSVVRAVLLFFRSHFGSKDSDLWLAMQNLAEGHRHIPPRSLRTVDECMNSGERWIFIWCSDVPGGRAYPWFDRPTGLEVQNRHPELYRTGRNMVSETPGFDQISISLKEAPPQAGVPGFKVFSGTMERYCSDQDNVDLLGAMTPDGRMVLGLWHMPVWDEDLQDMEQMPPYPGDKGPFIMWQCTDTASFSWQTAPPLH